MTSPIRVCMVVNSLDVGGLEKVVLSLLGSLDPSRFEVSLACLKGEGKLFSEALVPPERRLVLQSDRVKNFGLARVDPFTLVALRRFFRERRVDIVHAHNFAPLIYGGLAARSLGLHRPRVVYSEHNQVNSASERDLQKFRLYVRLADEVVAVSDDLKRILQGKLEITKPVRVIHNGIDDARFATASGTRVREELGIRPDEIVIGTAVVLSKQKGITYLVEAAKEVTRRVPLARIVVAGDGPLRQELMAQAEAAGLGDRMLFPGYRKDIPDLLSSFDIYVLSSLWEGLPLALLEALRLGKPIVCTRVGGNSEVIEDGVHGYLVAPKDPAQLADRLVRMAEDAPLRERIAVLSPERFREHFSLAAMTRQHEQLFREQASKRASR